jgi:signal transduction histidine kinase
MVEDARRQEPFASMPATTDANIGSYIGVPLQLSSGEVYGTLCAVDPTAHQFDKEDAELLLLLARLVAFEVEREEQARERDRAKDAFVAMASHELRSPLSSIKGYLELLEDVDAGQLTAEQRTFLEVASRNTDRLLGLVNDILDLSRIESGRIELDRAPLDVGTAVDQAADLLLPQLDAKRQTLVLRIEPDLPPALADGPRVAQVLTNLLSNAHKYTPEGGKITVRARHDHDRILVEVQDTGVGMSPEEQEQLFTRFFRARHPATREEQGTGLGLVITRQVVELHGGTIGVRSVPGAGSTFSFTLPLAP